MGRYGNAPRAAQFKLAHRDRQGGPDMAVRDWFSGKIRGGGEDAHPLASDQALERFVAGLPEDQPAVALQHACDALEDAIDVKLAPERICKALEALDARMQKPIAALRRSLFRDARGGQLSEASLAALGQYYRRVAALYEWALKSLAPGRRSDEELGRVSVMALRGLRALAQRNKLIHFGYRASDPELWGAVGRLLELARVLGVLRSSAQAYATTLRTTVAQEHLVALMFEMAPLANLLPAQMECLDLLLRRVAGGLETADRPGPATPYYFEPAQPRPPQRWQPDRAVAGKPIFFGAGASVAKLTALREETRGAAQPPEWALESGAGIDAFRGLVDLLLAQWSERPPRRRHERQPLRYPKLALRVVGGFELIRRMVANSEFVKAARDGVAAGGSAAGGDSRLTFADDADLERGATSASLSRSSTLELRKRASSQPGQVLEQLEIEVAKDAVLSTLVADASESGIGAAAPVGRLPWARPGALIGFRTADSLEWQLGVLRRVGRSAKGELTLGVERLPGNASRARVVLTDDLDFTPWRDEVLSAGGEDSVEGLLLSGPRTLLALPVSEYRVDQHLTLWANQQRSEVRITGIVQLGPDFVLATFA
jgi:hypothetical protein